MTGSIGRAVAPRGFRVTLPQEFDSIFKDGNLRQARRDELRNRLPGLAVKWANGVTRELGVVDYGPPPGWADRHVFAKLVCRKSGGFRGGCHLLPREESTWKSTT